MSFSEHNESKAIAAVLCPLLRARSPKVPFQCLAPDDDALFHTAVQSLQFLGIRKGFFQSRRNYVIESTLFNEFCFAASHPVIELVVTSPRKAAWTGAGEFKQTSSSDAMMLNPIFDAVGMAPPGPDALFKIDVTAVWSQISHLLEKLNPDERKADQERKRKEILDSIPTYQGPPADPKVLAETEALLAKIRGQAHPQPPAEGNEPF
jgi:hypothetical protein